MPAPTSYTEETLASFCVRQLGQVATALGWLPESPRVADAVHDALLAYGASTIADATDVPKLRALARLAIWRAAAAETAGHYRFGADQMSFDRQQVHAQARAMVADAEREAAALGVGPSALVVTAVVRPDDYYAYLPDELRTVS